MVRVNYNKMTLFRINGPPIHPEKVGKKQMLVYWMGPTCGKQDFPTHHGKPLQYTA